MAAMPSLPDLAAGEIFAGTAPCYSSGERLLALTLAFCSCEYPLPPHAWHCIWPYHLQCHLGPATLSPLAQNVLGLGAQGARNSLESTYNRGDCSLKHLLCMAGEEDGKGFLRGQAAEGDVQSSSCVLEIYVSGSAAQ